MLDIKKYFGRRGSEEKSTFSDSVTKTMSLGGLRPDRPTTTTFNRNLVIGLIGVFAAVFAFGLFYGMGNSGDKKKAEETGKNKKINNTVHNGTQLDNLPSSYGTKSQNTGTSNGVNSVSKPPIQATNALPQQTSQTVSMPRQSVNYSTPPIRQYVDYSIPSTMPRPSVATFQQLSAPPPSDSTRVAVPAVDSLVEKERQELAAARKSQIRFNLK